MIAVNTVLGVVGHQKVGKMLLDEVKIYIYTHTQNKLKSFLLFSDGSALQLKWHIYIFVCPKDVLFTEHTIFAKNFSQT